MSEKIPDKAAVFQLLCQAKVSDLAPPSRSFGSWNPRHIKRSSPLGFHGRHGKVRYGHKDTGHRKCHNHNITTMLKKCVHACMHMMKVILEAGGAALYSQHAGQSQRLIMRHALIDRHDILMRSFQEWTAAEYDTRVTQRTLRLELHQSMDARTWMPRNEVKKRFTADVQQPLQVWGIYRLHRSIVFVQQPFQVWGLISINDFVLSHSWTSSVTCWSPFRPSMDGRNCKKRLRFAGIDSKSQIRIFLWRQKFSSPTRIQVYNI